MLHIENVCINYLKMAKRGTLNNNNKSLSFATNLNIYNGICWMKQKKGSPCNISVTIVVDTEGIHLKYSFV